MIFSFAVAEPRKKYCNYYIDFKHYPQAADHYFEDLNLYKIAKLKNVVSLSFRKNILFYTVCLCSCYFVT